MAYRLDIPISADDVLIVGTGGEGRERAEYRDGQATGQSLRHGNGRIIRSLSGVSASVAGIGLDGCSVTTTSDIEEVPAGTLYRVSGEVTLTARADARMMGRGADARPRGEIIASLFIEQLEPVGDVTQLMKSPAETTAQTAQPQKKSESAA